MLHVAAIQGHIENCIAFNFRAGDYKLIEGTAGRFNGRYQPQTHGKRLVSIRREAPGRHFNQTLLFNLKGETSHFI